MLRTLMTARQAMNLEQTRIDTLANNLANVATGGFRQVLTSVTDRTPAGGGAAPTALAGAGDRTNLDPMSRAADSPLLMTHKVDNRPGLIDSTGRDTDLALSGRGFFVLKDTEGNEFYTRDGSFRLDETGKLVSPAGLEVQGEGGAVNVAGGKFTVDTDGTVTVGAANRGRLRIMKFEQPERLEHRGDGLMRAAEDVEAVAVEPGETTVMQGFVEGSNVDPVQTLVDMIAAQRAFEIGSKVLQANDEMLGKSVNTLGRNS